MEGPVLETGDVEDVPPAEGTTAEEELAAMAVVLFPSSIVMPEGVSDEKREPESLSSPYETER